MVHLNVNEPLREPSPPLFLFRFIFHTDRWTERYESRLICHGVIRHLHRIAELIIIFYPNDRIGNVFPCIMHVSRRNTFAETVNSFRGNICLANGIGIKRRFLARFEFFLRMWSRVFLSCLWKDRI